MAAAGRTDGVLGLLAIFKDQPVLVGRYCRMRPEHLLTAINHQLRNTKGLRMNHNTFYKIRNIFLIAASYTFISITNLQADDAPCPNCGCSHGIQLVEVSRTICKMVTKQEPIKKTVYEKKEVPYCEHCVAPIGHHHVCPQCKACGKTRTVLVKKSIECGKKTVHECVSEVVKEQVAVPCKECGFCTRHGSLLHRAGTANTVPEINLVDNAAQESGSVTLAEDPKLRKLNTITR